MYIFCVQACMYSYAKATVTLNIMPKHIVSSAYLCLYDAFHVVAIRWHPNDQNVTWHLPICHYYKKFIAAATEFQNNLVPQKKNPLRFNPKHNLLQLNKNWIYVGTALWSANGTAVKIMEKFHFINSLKHAMRLCCALYLCNKMKNVSDSIIPMPTRRPKKKWNAKLRMNCHWPIANIN